MSFDQVGKVPLCISFDHIDVAPTMHTSKPYTKVAATHFVRCIKGHHVEQGVEEYKDFGSFSNKRCLGFEPMVQGESLCGFSTRRSSSLSVSNLHVFPLSMLFLLSASVNMCNTDVSSLRRFTMFWKCMHKDSARSSA